MKNGRNGTDDAGHVTMIAQTRGLDDTVTGAIIRDEKNVTPVGDRSRPYSRADDRPSSQVEDTSYSRGASD